MMGLIVRMGSEVGFCFACLTDVVKGFMLTPVCVDGSHHFSVALKMATLSTFTASQKSIADL
jgi:hypothetical protein